MLKKRELHKERIESIKINKRIEELNRLQPIRTAILGDIESRLARVNSIQEFRELDEKIDLLKDLDRRIKYLESGKLPKSTPDSHIEIIEKISICYNEVNRLVRPYRSGNSSF